MNLVLPKRGSRNAVIGALFSACVVLPQCTDSKPCDDDLAEAGSAGEGGAATSPDAGAGGQSGAPEGGSEGGGPGGGPVTPSEGGSGGTTAEDPPKGGEGGTIVDVPTGGTNTGSTIGFGGRYTIGGAGHSGGRPSTGGRLGFAGGASYPPQPAPGPEFMLGADISSVQEAVDAGATFVDTDGVTKPFVEILKTHGFNYARLRTFVDPDKLYGYANPNGDPSLVKDEAYCDGAHTAEFGREIRDAGLNLLVDLHYSDNWADPGKQVIPERWRNVATIEEMADGVRTYTRELIQTLVDGGARPDIVQIGNEITPGMLIQVPAENPQPDQWGNMRMVQNPVNGSSTALNWPNLAHLLKAGAEGVREVDPDIQIMLHIENTKSSGAVIQWVNSALSNGVEFDILGLSCYTTWHGSPSVWESTFQTVAARFPELSFVIAEYNPEPRRANEIMRDLPDRRGLGTFFWEPTESGTWGGSLFERSGLRYTAIANSFAVFDAIRADFELE